MNPLDLNKETEIVSEENSVMLPPSDNNKEQNEPVAHTEKETDKVQEQEIVNPPVTEKSEEMDFAHLSKEELIEVLKLLLEKEVDEVKGNIELIKQYFYKSLKSDNEEQRKNFVENGGNEDDFVSEKNELEEIFKTLMTEFRTKKAALLAKVEKEKESNLVQKKHLLEQMKVLSESNDDVSSHINEFKSIQQKWKTIGQVPQSASTDLWKQYNVYQESFWDLIKINNELREYDFKKNLESKLVLCETAEKLNEDTDVISAFQQLQKLHEEWHELGPVARELRDQLWNRFREASTAINKKHQSYFDALRKDEDDNYTAKNELCDKIEAFDFSQLNNYKGWDEATKMVLAWQEEWRGIGFAPRKVNQKVFERYRKACDAFFTAKGNFYKESKSVLSDNLEKKNALCEKAEQLKDSTEWKETTDKLIQMQKEWKSIGPVNKKISDEIWKRFITACDCFFEQKGKNSSGQRTAENDNLLKKKELIEKINTLEKTEDSSATVKLLHALMAEWSNIGHVPFKEKDKIYKEYRTAVDKQFDLLHVDTNNRRMDNFRSNIKDIAGKGENKLNRERDKLMRSYEHLKSEIATYENNIGFFTTNSKKGGGLIKEMERKIEALKEESMLIEKKINLIDESY